MSQENSDGVYSTVWVAHSAPESLAQFKAECLDQFAPERVAHFAAESVADLLRNMHFISKKY